MAATVGFSLPLTAATAATLSSCRPLVCSPLCPRLSFSNSRNFASLSNPNNSSSNRRLMVAAVATSGKYIREDYLVKKVSAKEVEEIVKGERSVPIVLDFYATWCGPCILMAQELETLAVEYENNVLFLKVDTDDEFEFARNMQVRGLPTLYFISPDPAKDAIRTEGLIPPEMIKNIIDSQL